MRCSRVVRTHINSELSELRQPVCGYAIERVRVVYGIYYADDMRLADFHLQHLSVLRPSCVHEVNTAWANTAHNIRTSRVNNICRDILRGDLWRYGNLGYYVLYL